jgi:shikimate kinase
MTGQGSAHHLVLVGLIGAGKTTVGALCAQRLGRDFLDTDHIVEALAACTVSEIFAETGEAGFRTLERQAISDACAAPSPSVIACGGGAVLDPDNRSALHAAGTVVWLRAAARSLADRVGVAASRPLLADGDREATLARLAALREPAYEAVADVAIDTDGKDADAVADAVIAAFAAADTEVRHGA